MDITDWKVLGIMEPMFMEAQEALRQVSSGQAFPLSNLSLTLSVVHYPTSFGP